MAYNKNIDYADLINKTTDPFKKAEYERLRNEKILGEGLLGKDYSIGGNSYNFGISNYYQDKANEITRQQEQNNIYQQYLSQQEAIRRQQQEEARRRQELLERQKRNQIGDVNMAYDKAREQAYIERMRGERNLPRVMARAGQTGGLAESSLVKQNADYNNSLNMLNNEEAKAIAGINSAIDEQALAEQKAFNDQQLANAQKDIALKYQIEQQQRAEQQKAYDKQVEEAKLYAKYGDFSKLKELGIDTSLLEQQMEEQAELERQQALANINRINNTGKGSSKGNSKSSSKGESGKSENKNSLEDDEYVPQTQEEWVREYIKSAQAIADSKGKFGSKYTPAEVEKGIMSLRQRGVTDINLLKSFAKYFGYDFVKTGQDTYEVK